MKIFIALVFFISSVFATLELSEIEASITKASSDFEIQKSENNITKLLAISKIVYENNKKLKELKSQFVTKLTIELVSKKALDRLQIEDTVELHVETVHDTSEEYTRADLSFFIYDGETLLVTKDVELYEKGGVHKESLKFKIAEPSEKYKICAVFKENAKEYKECKEFGVTQPIVVKPIIASTTLGATSSDKTLLPNREFFLFMPFENKTDTPLKGKIEITDSGDVIFSEDFIKKPEKGFRKAGVLVPASLIYEKQSLHVSISLGAEGINSVEMETSIKIASFDWKVIFPKKLKAKQSKNFEIIAPKFFVKPLHVEVNPNGGVLIGQVNNALKGTISTVTNKKEFAYVDVIVKDAKGEKVQKRVTIGLNQDYVEKIPKVVAVPKKTYTKSKKTIAVGATKMMMCSVYSGTYGTYHGDCLHRYDGRYWQAVDGEFRLYYDDSEKDFSYSSYDIYETKDALAIVGNSKNGKKDGKLTHYYGNGKVKSVDYYKNDKKVESKSIGYFSNGSLRYEHTTLEGHTVRVSYDRDKRIGGYYEKIGNYALQIKSFYKLGVYGPSGAVCELNFKNKKVSGITCFYPNSEKRKVGEKTIWSKSVQFYGRKGGYCKNRVDYYGKFDECKSGEEITFLKQFDIFTSILAKSKENGKYFKGYDFDGLLWLAGESLYQGAYNVILTKELYLPSNPTKQCKSRYNAKWKMKDLNKKIKNKKPYYIKAAKHGKYSKYNIKMVMTLFANSYYKKERKSDKCYTELRNFYKHLGYLNAY